MSVRFCIFRVTILISFSTRAVLLDFVLKVLLVLSKVLLVTFTFSIISLVIEFEEYMNKKNANKTYIPVEIDEYNIV